MSTEPIPQEIDGFRVTGFSARTSNPDEIAGAGRIADLWRRFAAEVHQLPGGPPIAVYDSYESDHTGPYTITVGNLADEHDPRPEGGVSNEVLSGLYLAYPVPEGEPSLSLGATWQQIWGDFSSPDFPWRRSFRCDFELHAPEGDREMVTHIFVGVEAPTR